MQLCYVEPSRRVDDPRLLGLAMQTHAQSPAGVEWHTQRNLEAIRGLQRDNETLVVLGALDRPHADAKDIARIFESRTPFQSQRQHVRQRHHERACLIERKLHTDRRAGTIEEPKLHCTAVAHYLASGQFPAANLHGLPSCALRPEPSACCAVERPSGCSMLHF